MKLVWNIIFFILVALLLSTPFAVFPDIRFGVVKGKVFWFYGSSALVLIFGLFHIFFKKKPCYLVFNLVDAAVIVLYFYTVVRIFLDNTNLFLLDKFAINSLLVGLYISFRFYTASAAPKYRTSFLLLLCVVLMMVSIGQSVAGFMQLYGREQSNNAYFQVTSSFANPAPLAFFLAAIAPISLGIYFYASKQLQGIGLPNNRNGVYFRKFALFGLILLSIISLLPSLVLLPVLKIRTGWLMALAGCGMVLLFHNWEWFKSIYRRLNKISIVGLCVFIMTICTGFYLLKKDSADGRLLVYKVTLNKIMEKPFAGHGYHSFYANYNNWQADWFESHSEELDGKMASLAGNVKIAYNEFLEVWVEIGIIGILLFILIMFLLLRSLFQHILISEKSNGTNTFSESQKGLVICFSGLLMAVIVGCFTYSPFNGVSVKLLFFIALSVLGTLLPFKTFPLNKKNSYLPELLIPLVFIGILFFLNSSYKRYESLTHWVRAHHLFTYQLYADAIKEYKPLLPQLMADDRFLQEYAKALSLNNENKESNAILKKSHTYGSDVFSMITLGDNYMQLRQYTLAEKAYKRAGYMQPAMFYPKFLLVKLYVETNNEQKAVSLAKKLLDKKEKISSVALNEMKTEMKNLIDTYAND